MVTRDTTKLGLALAVAAFGMATGATTLAGVGWIDQHYRHARFLRLVADEEPQLRERPIAVSRSLPCPLTLARVRMPLNSSSAIARFVRSALATSRLLMWWSNTT